MWPVPAEFLPALGQSHGIVARIDAWQGTRYLGTVPFSEAQVTVTARSRVRRTLTATVDGALYPTEPTDLLSPYATVLQAWSGIRYGQTDLLVPVFTGKIEDDDHRDQITGPVDIRARDRMGDVNDARFEHPRAAPTDYTIAGTITALLTEAVPGVHITIDPGVDMASTVPSGLLWDTDRGKAVDDLAQSIGAEVFATPDGGFRIRNVPTIDDPAVWTITEGAGGTLVSAGRKVSREGVYNVVVVVVERANGDLPLRFVVEDTNITSPTYVGGLFGRVPRFLRNPIVTSADQAIQAGRALLARSIGATRVRTVTCVPNPALEAGDVIGVRVAGGVETHIADTFTLPLHADGGAMPVGTRSTKPDAGDL